jgi:hypothetical protein
VGEEVGGEAAGVGDAADSSSSQPLRVGVVAGEVAGRQRVGLYVGGDLRCRPCRAQETQEVESGAHDEAAVGAGAEERFALDDRFEGAVGVAVVERSGCRRGCRAGPAEVKPGDPRCGGLERGSHGGAGVFAEQLAELALAGQHPQRVGDLGSETLAQVVGAGQGFETLPGGDRAHVSDSWNFMLWTPTAMATVAARLIDGTFASRLNGR